MQDQQLAYVVDSMVVDVLLKETRAPLYRTRAGTIRPILSVCFAPKAKQVMAYSLNTEPLSPQELATLLYAAFTASQEVPYGGLPDTITCDAMPALTPALQQTLEHLGIRVQQGSQDEPMARGASERFFARLTREFWDTYSHGATSDTQCFPLRIMDVPLCEADYLLRSYLLAYNEAIQRESDEAPPISRREQPSHLERLLTPPLPRILTQKGLSYLTQTYWHERFASLLPGTTVLLRPVPSFSASLPETIDVFVHTEWICSFSVKPLQSFHHRFGRSIESTSHVD